jgi:outer membrane protein assembly factor BamD
MRVIAVLFIALALTACASTGDVNSSGDTAKQAQQKKTSAKKLYKKAHAKLQTQNYRDALKLYDEIEANYPFSPYATQAQLEAIYASFRKGDAEVALASADRFLREHPRYPDADYVYYLQGLINFSRAARQNSPLFSIDGATRDNSYVTQAFQSFNLLLRRFPKSRYAADARQRMIYLKDEMARRDYHIAHYYMRRGAWVAANRRAREIIKQYQGTTSVPKALLIMEKSYRKLGMDGSAEKVHKILAANFPKKAKQNKATQAVN